MDTSKVNIAIHIRLGDRMGLQEVSQDYFLLLEEFMRDVTEAVLRQDVDSPIFHVFTETLQPCPHKQTGLFKELPMWPVEMDQVRAYPVECRNRCALARHLRLPGNRAAEPEITGGDLGEAEVAAAPIQPLVHLFGCCCPAYIHFLS